MSWEGGSTCLGFGIAIFTWVAPMIWPTLPRWLISFLLVFSIILILVWPASLATNWANANPKFRLLVFIVVGIILGGFSFGMIGYVTNETQSGGRSSLAATKLTHLPPMPSLLSLFMTDFKGKGSGGGVVLRGDGYADLTFEENNKLRIFYQVVEDYGNRSKFMSFYIPSSPHTYEAIKFLATGYKQYIELPFRTEQGNANSPSVTKTSDLVFTGRLFIYHEDSLPLSKLGKLSDAYENEKLSPEFRTTSYALSVWETIRSSGAEEGPEYEIRDGIPQLIPGPKTNSEITKPPTLGIPDSSTQ